MRLSSAAMDFARLQLARAMNGGDHFHPSLLARSLGGRRFVGMVTRNKIKKIDPNVVIGSLSFAVACLGLYVAIASDFDSKINTLRSDIKGEIRGVTTMLESKLDGQDRKLSGHDRMLAGQDRKVEGFGEKIVLQDLKYEPKKSWSWFGLNSSLGESKDQSVIDAVSKVVDNVNNKFEVIHDVTNKLDAKLNAMHDELIAKTKDSNGRSSKK